MTWILNLVAELKAILCPAKTSVNPSVESEARESMEEFPESTSSVALVASWKPGPARVMAEPLAVFDCD